jgi:predicted dienelactone hydrolase
MNLRRTMCLFLLCLAGVSTHGETKATYRVGRMTRSFVPPGSYDWRGAQTHALVTEIWYPASSSATEQQQWIGGPSRPLFDAGKAAPNAELATSSKRSLIVLSHGTGGSALQLAWLGTVLAAHGYIAAAVNHPGNNALEPYTIPGFTLWWERAGDLSRVVDALIADPLFGNHIDPRRIGAAGFSLGGYTMIELAGGTTRLSAYQEFCASPRADDMCKTPPEFSSDLFQGTEKLAASDASYAAALKHDSDSYRDPRVRAVFAIAPALGPAFPSDGLKRISVPVAIVAGEKDENVPIASSAKYFAASIPNAKLTILPGAVGHYVFLDTCTDDGKKVVPGVLCSDAPGIDRDAIHKRVATMAVEFFDANVK